MSKTELAPILVSEPKIPRCSDCDSDCWDVDLPLLCWLGTSRCGCNIGIADGLCPFLTDEVPLPPK